MLYYLSWLSYFIYFFLFLVVQGALDARSKIPYAYHIFTLNFYLFLHKNFFQVIQGWVNMITLLISGCVSGIGLGLSREMKQFGCITHARFIITYLFLFTCNNLRVKVTWARKRLRLVLNSIVLARVYLVQSVWKSLDPTIEWGESI